MVGSGFGTSGCVTVWPSCRHLSLRGAPPAAPGSVSRLHAEPKRGQANPVHLWVVSSLSQVSCLHVDDSENWLVAGGGYEEVPSECPQGHLSMWHISGQTMTSSSQLDAEVQALGNYEVRRGSFLAPLLPPKPSLPIVPDSRHILREGCCPLEMSPGSPTGAPPLLPAPKVSAASM